MTLENPPSVAPAPIASNDKALVILCHVSSIIGVGLILPFIVWLVKKDESDMVAMHAKEALNFHLSVIFYAICCVPLIFVVIGFPLLFVIAIGSLVLAIIAAVKASDGVMYRYPLTIRLIK